MSAPQNSQVPESLRTRENECHTATFVQTTHGSPPLQDPSVRLTSISWGQPSNIHRTHSPSPPITPPKQLYKTVRWLLINVADGTRHRKALCQKRLFPIEKKRSEVKAEAFLVQKCVDVALFQNPPHNQKTADGSDFV